MLIYTLWQVKVSNGGMGSMVRQAVLKTVTGKTAVGSIPTLSELNSRGIIMKMVMEEAPKIKALAIQNESECRYYSEEGDLSCGVMLKCSLGLKSESL